MLRVFSGTRNAPRYDVVQPRRRTLAVNSVRLVASSFLIMFAR
jgi:hypothetical protein